VRACIHMCAVAAWLFLVRLPSPTVSNVSHL